MLPDYDDQENNNIKPLPNFIPLDAKKSSVISIIDENTPPIIETVSIEQENEQLFSDTSPINLDETPASIIEENDDNKSSHQYNDEMQLVQNDQSSSTNDPIEIVETKATDVMLSNEVNHNSTDTNYVEQELSKDSEELPLIEKNEGKTENKNNHVLLDTETYNALLAAANKTLLAANHENNTGYSHIATKPPALQRTNTAVQQEAYATEGQEQVKSGAQALAEGGMSLLGGVAALTGTAFQAGGQVASSLAEAFRNRNEKASSTPIIDAVSVLPRLSEYRINQAEKAANTYERSRQALWESGDLPNVLKKIEEHAQKTGLSIDNVMQAMRPNSEMADLHQEFCNAVSASSEAKSNKKEMDKALSGWLRQYDRGQEELLHHKVEDNPRLEALRKRLDESRKQMEKNTINTPLFEDENQSHNQKLEEAIKQIMEKIKEIAKDFVNLLRGKKEVGENYAPGS